MIAFIIEAITTECAKAGIKTEFIRDAEKSSGFRPVFQINLNEKPTDLFFTSAMLYNDAIPLPHLVQAIVMNILKVITEKLNEPVTA